MLHRFLLHFLPLLIAGGPACAATYCVGTTQQLLAALTQIEQNAYTRDPVDLRIRSGTYALPAPAYGNHTLRFGSGFLAASYRISGGWNPGCSSRSNASQLATTLDGQGARGVMMVRRWDVTPSEAPPAEIATLRIENLRFANGSVTVGGAALTGCLSYEEVAATVTPGQRYDYRLVVDRTVFRGCQNALDIGKGIATTVRNSLFVENYGDVAAIRAWRPTGPVSIINNTFRRNEVIGGGVYGAEVATVGGNAPAPAKYIVNNVFADTVQTGANAHQIVGDGLTFVRSNLVQDVDGDSVYGFPYLSGNLVTEPMFAGADDHRLAANSPLRDAGENSATGGIGDLDLAGAVRMQGSAVDLGAYELGPAPVLPDALFTHGFE